MRYISGLRTGLDNFARYFRNYDAVHCALEANSIVKALPWDKDTADFMERLPPKEHMAWIWSAIGMPLFLYLHLPPFITKMTGLRGVQIGLLMLASCPMQKSQLVRESSESVRLAGGRLRPSVFAQGVDPGSQVIERRTIMNEKPEIIIAPPLLRNHFRGVPSPYAEGQFDYLTMVSELIEYFGRAKCTVCGPWLFEILRCGKLIQEERERLRTQYPTDHETKFVDSWDFQVPEYESPNVRGGPKGK